MPVLFFDEAAHTFARPSVEAPPKRGRGFERAEHVGGDGWVVDVGARRDGGEDKFGKCESEGVAHRIDEDIRH